MFVNIFLFNFEKIFFFLRERCYTIDEYTLETRTLRKGIAMVNVTGERLKSLRLQRGMTQKDVADKLGVKSQAIHKYETGIVINLKRSTIEKLAQIFDVSPLYIMGLEDSVGAYNNIEQAPTFYTVPVIGSIACGTPIEAIENKSGEVQVDNRYKVDFALICRGDSMINARIFDGDVVYIRAQPDVENGEIAAVLIDNEATLKRVYKYPNRIELRSENPTFPVLNYEAEMLKEIRIIGKAIAFSSEIR